MSFEPYLTRRSNHIVYRYYQLSALDLNFFCRWFACINPGLNSWNALDLGQLSTEGSCWKELTHSQAQMMGALYNGSKRGRLASTSEVRLDNRKRRWAES